MQRMMPCRVSLPLVLLLIAGCGGGPVAVGSGDAAGSPASDGSADESVTAIDGASPSRDAVFGPDAEVKATDVAGEVDAPEASPDVASPAPADAEFPDLAADLPATDGPVARLVLNQSEDSFPAAAVGCGPSGPAATFRVQNRGDFRSGPVVVKASSGFVVSRDECTGRMLVARDSCLVDVEFQPSKPGPNVGTLSVTATPGVGSEARLTGEGLAVAAVWTPGSGTLPSLQAGETGSTTARFLLENIGAQAALSLSLSPSPDFDIVQNSCQGATTLVQNGACVVVARFRPETPGAKSLEVTATIAGCAPGSAVAKLSATAEPADGLVIDQREADLGYAPLECPSTPHVLRISNMGTGSQGPLTVTLSERFSTAQDGCTGVTLAPGSSCEIAVVFTPRQNLERETRGTLLVSGPQGSARAPLVGHHAFGDGLFVVAVPRVFGQVQVGASATMNVYLSNFFGAQPVPFPISLAGTTAADYSIASNDCPAVLKGGAMCQVQVVFTPKAVGARDAELRAGSLCGSTIVVDLGGIGF
jgi:hypothetical protein